jgi:TonB family protein
VTTSPTARAPSSTPHGAGAVNRSTSVSASASAATAAAARAAAVAAESNAANRIASAAGAASSAASRTASTPVPEHGTANRVGAAPAGPRAPATGAHDANVLNRPPFAGALAHPVNPAATPDPTKAARPAPRPIVIEHFTPESLMPPETGRHPGTNTSQAPAAPSHGPKESNFVGSSAASGHVDSLELTPSEVAAALESVSVSDPEASVPRFLLPVAAGAVIVLALALAGVYVLRTHADSTPPVVETYQDSPLPTQADATPPLTAAEESAASSAAVGSGNLHPGDAATRASTSGQPFASPLAATPTAAVAPAGAGSSSRSMAAAPAGAGSPSRSAAAAAAVSSSGAMVVPSRAAESSSGAVAVPAGAAASYGPTGAATRGASSFGPTGAATREASSFGVEAAAAGTASPSDTTPPSDIHEEIPDIPPRIRQSIRGHVRVAVRLIVDKEGSVFAALVDEPGPSRYFERLAIEAAKKWTFPPLDTTGSRLELVRFDFTRQGVTGRAVEIE